MPSPIAGYREIEHTADWELQVWAPDPAKLLEQAARGMYALSGIRLQQEPRIERTLKLQANGIENLLVAFLSELLYLGEHERVGFDSYQIHLEEGALQASLQGARIDDQSKEIKAVTYHKLAVRQTRRGMEVNIVFDV